VGQEIERKFLVNGDEWRQGVCTTIRQGYLSAEKAYTVRVRTKADEASGDPHAFLTIKGASNGAARAEYEYEIPVADADELLDTLCRRPLIEKRRYTVEHAGMTWEVDEFFGDNQGLIVAEIELTTPEQSFVNPPWLGAEVTGDSRYFNAALVQRPYNTWPKNS
jgi:CYTH domain-containing protein